MTEDTDDIDDLYLPEEADIASTGAAADGAEMDDGLKKLPRILRYAMLVKYGREHLRERLVAEIAEIAPGMAETLAWPESDDPTTGLALAAALDRLAVTQDKPDLRSLADCVRLLTLPLPGPASLEVHHRRVGKSLLQAMTRLHAGIGLKLAAEVEAIALGWTALPVQMPLSRLRNALAVVDAYYVGRQMANNLVAFAEAKVREEFEAKLQVLKKRAAQTADEADPAATPDIEVDENHMVVCRMTDADLKSVKVREFTAGLKPVINTALPLAPVPPLHAVRSQLLFEFPYAAEVIDFALADLVGRHSVRLRPLVLVGEPGGGKSRFGRRLAEVLGLGCWRTDASRSDGAMFGGTDKRWNTAEPCHPFLAVARFQQANPIIVIDELEKAGTRSDYGRFWDCLLGFLEPETAARYPDPALQDTLDLSQVSYIATANSLDPLPAPLRDRFRIITFPKPSVDDLEALLPAVLADLAAESGVDHRWIEPLSGKERDLVAASWRGGSVRRLRRVVEVVVRTRDKFAVRN